MTTVVLAVLLLAALVLGGRRLADLRELGAASSSLRPSVNPAPAAARSPGSVDVSVVVPARNEALTLPALLGSLRLLDPPVREVVVVDDGSADATAQVAQAGADVVLTAPPPPAGWTGKAWACHLGAEGARGGYLLFLDADTVLAPEAVADLLALHDHHGGLVSVQPYHEVVRPYEQLSAYFNLVSLMGCGAFARRPARHPMAFGPCLLTSRADYDRAGGHAAVRADILDDARLAAAYDRAGMPVSCAIGGAALRMRMYPGGPRQLAEGWTKNIASGAGQADRRSALAAAAWVAAHFAVAVGALTAVVGALTGDRSGLASGTLWLWVVGWLAVSWQLRRLLRRIGSFHWLTWVAFPVPLLGFGALFLWSTVLTHVRGSVRWRGRTVAVTDDRSSLEDA